jgi:periplasmic protein TonB
MTALAATHAPFRRFDLPWRVDSSERRRLRRLLAAAAIVTVPLAIVLPYVPLPERPANAVVDVPERLARLVEAKLPPPAPPAPPPEVKAPEPEPVAEAPPVSEPPPQPRPTTHVRPSEQPRPDPRRKAAASGLLKFQDQLAALRDSQAVTKASAPQSLSGNVSEATRIERSLVTANVARGSGGIDTSKLSRGYGAGTGALAGHATTRIGPVAGVAGGGGASAGSSRADGGGSASRSREEIELVFDRNKSAIYALYSRALRSNPALKGKLVLELTIAPDGQVTDCRVVSSELDDSDLERKLLARVKMFRFEDKDVATVTTTKPIDFFPA